MVSSPLPIAVSSIWFISGAFAGIEEGLVVVGASDGGRGGVARLCSLPTGGFTTNETIARRLECSFHLLFRGRLVFTFSLNSRRRGGTVGSLGIFRSAHDDRSVV